MKNVVTNTKNWIYLQHARIMGKSEQSPTLGILERNLLASGFPYVGQIFSKGSFKNGIHEQLDNWRETMVSE
jgi:hypothetical protein